MDFNLETNSWQVLPVGGDTGMAYMGVSKNKKLFLKRNTSPFLAALSLEGVTPRLMWTKRMSSGDTLTAQEWLNGRSLHKSEMVSKQVSDLLYKVHHSKLLKKMLRQVGGTVVTPTSLLDSYFDGLSSDLRKHPLLARVATQLKRTMPQLDPANFEVCHGDLNHKNWLLSDAKRLYLVDWESAVVGDPALDLSMLMCLYVPRDQWHEWLERYYGREIDSAFQARVDWYTMMNLLFFIKHSHGRGRFHEMNQDICKLADFVDTKN